MKKLTIIDIPKGYNWAAVDSCGTAAAYKYKPFISNLGWETIKLGDIWLCLGDGFDATDWENSLIFINYEKIN